MTSTILHIGSTIASDLRDSSVYSDRSKQCPKTVGDLLRLLEDNPPREFSMLRSTCSMLADYFGKPADEILFDSVQEARTRLRPYLESRKYAENSIRTYVNHVRILLNRAKECGWNTTMEHSAAWRPVLELAAEAKCKDVSNYLAKLKKTPRQVTVEDVERWAELRLQEGASYSRIKGQQTRFWRLLRHCGCMEDVPLTLLREKDYGVPLGTFVPQLQVEANELLRWKLQEYSIDRPSAARHRPVSSKKLQKELNSLYGFAVNIRGDSDIRSLSDLITKGASFCSRQLRKMGVRIFVRRSPLLRSDSAFSNQALSSLTPT
jgi:hypothetical protein